MIPNSLGTNGSITHGLAISTCTDTGHLALAKHVWELLVLKAPQETPETSSWS